MPATRIAFRSPPASATPSFIDGREAEELEQAIYGKIRERAYLLFEQSGREPGNEDANWLRAESETLRSGTQVRESRELDDAQRLHSRRFPGRGLQIVVRPTRVLVRAMVDSNAEDSSERTEKGKGSTRNLSRRESHGRSRSAVSYRVL